MLPDYQRRRAEVKLGQIADLMRRKRNGRWYTSYRFPDPAKYQAMQVAAGLAELREGRRRARLAGEDVLAMRRLRGLA